MVAEKEAEAAVAAAKAAARQQQEHALQRCNAEWTDRLGGALYAHVASPLIPLLGTPSAHKCIQAATEHVQCMPTVLQVASQHSMAWGKTACVPA